MAWTDYFKGQAEKRRKYQEAKATAGIHREEHIMDTRLENERKRSELRKKHEEYKRLKRENFRATRTGKTLSFIGQGISAGVQRYKASRSRPRYRKVKAKAIYRKVKAKARTSRRRDPWDF